MRLWSLHPRYLDPQGLVALWREALLAQAVLLGKTRGYTHHPQLQRFLDFREPTSAIGTYLTFVLQEAAHRGYSFAAAKIVTPGTAVRLSVTSGQLELETAHLTAKLRARSPALLEQLTPPCQPHPMLRLRAGPVASWERERHDVLSHSRK